MTVLASYRGVICDLDGVVYRGPHAVPGAVPSLNSMIADQVPVVFATNNASRPPAAAATHLRELGLSDEGWSVVTSAQAAAAYLTDRLGPGARVLAVGGSGVTEALGEVGLKPVRVDELADGQPVEAVVQGAGLEVTWRDLAEVGYLAQAGALWVATNLDATIPTARGLAPGNGAFVGAVRATTPVSPYVTGKPGTALFDLACSRLGCDPSDTIMVGDRLDTDIVGARSAGVDSMFVLGGASSLRDLAFAEDDARPTYFAFDLSGLLQPGLRRRPEPDDAVTISPEGVVSVRRTVTRHRLLQAVVSTAWHARDHDQPLAADADSWAEVERHLGL
ncbi:HAD-IIA family hydrolase [Kribbella sp. NPDC026596]|uniref:HAD-IIA family hydrolase n=1 Tax=Kribbella sp. NPDC026596 TaxID=3155122 RepID=UPI0033DCDE1D